MISATRNLRQARWASTALDIPTPARRPLYRLFASLHGFVIEATVFGHGAKGYAYAVVLDSVHVPGSPAGGYATLEAAIHAAKATFTEWTRQLLERV